MTVVPDDDADRLLALLTAEIDHLNSENQQHGWTTWALLVSLASILWIVSKELEVSTALRLENVAVLFLVGSMMFYWVGTLKTTLDYPPDQTLKPNQSIRVFSSSRFFGRRQSKLGALLLVAHTIALFIIADFGILSAASTWFRVVINVLLGFVLVTNVMSFVLLFLTMPWSPSATTRAGRIVAYCILAVILVSIGFIVASILSRWSFTWTEIRVAALFTIGAQLIVKLAADQSARATAAELIAVRRLVLLNEITVADARAIVEGIMIGEPAEPQVNAIASPVVSWLSSMADDFERHADELTYMLVKLKAYEGPVTIEDEKELTRVIAANLEQSKAIRAQVDQVTENLRRMRQELRRFRIGDASVVARTANQKATHELQRLGAASSRCSDKQSALIAFADAKGYASKQRPPPEVTA